MILAVNSVAMKQWVYSLRNKMTLFHLSWRNYRFSQFLLLLLVLCFRF